MVRTRMALVLMMWVLACGRVLERPLSVEILGFSARADELVLYLFDEASQSGCEGLELSGFDGLVPVRVSRWRRGTESVRELELEAIDGDVAVIMAFALDGDGVPLQFACARVRFEDIVALPGGLLTLSLSRRQ